jgi:hypothetical protein
MITAILKNDEDLIEGENGAVHGGEDDGVAVGHQAVADHQV